LRTNKINEFLKVKFKRRREIPNNSIILNLHIKKCITFALPFWVKKEFKIIYCDMKKEIHPEDYRMVVFKDMTNEYTFMTRSTAATKETIVWEDGNEYPLIKLEITYKSHPFFTGVQQFVDTAGRIDKFNNRYAKFKK